MEKLLYKSNKLCGMCIHWDGYRLGYIKHKSGGFFIIDNTVKAKCMNPKDFAHFEKTPFQSCPRFENRF